MLPDLTLIKLTHYPLFDLFLRIKKITGHSFHELNPHIPDVCLLILFLNLLACLLKKKGNIYFVY